jgi:ABC-type uncharacterized transport system substrate-binding protein
VEHSENDIKVLATVARGQYADRPEVIAAYSTPAMSQVE